MSNEEPIGTVEVKARTAVKVDDKTETILTLNTIIRASANEGGRLVICLPMGGDRSSLDVVLGGPDSAPKIANYLRRVARDLDRMDQDYRFTGSGVLRQIMEAIRQLRGAEHVHLDSVTFKGMGGLIDDMGTDPAKMERATKMLMHSFRGVLPIHLELEVLKIIAERLRIRAGHTVGAGVKP